MSDASKIEWTDSTWNPVTGCTKVSPGCDHCYAETFAERWRGVPGHPFEHGFDVQLREGKLSQPLHWKRPRRVFVNSMSDLFHAAVPAAFISSVWDVMAATPQHTYQVLTKRAGRMRSLLCRRAAAGQSPLPNVWLGVSAEDQRWARVRIPALLDVPAAVRCISAEPLLGPLDLAPWLGQLGWVIVGGESGPGARPMDLAWAASVVAQCQAAGVPVFVKQVGAVAGRQLGAGPKGGDWAAWPQELRVRQFPSTAP